MQQLASVVLGVIGVAHSLCGLSLRVIVYCAASCTASIAKDSRSVSSDSVMRIHICQQQTHSDTARSIRRRVIGAARNCSGIAMRKLLTSSFPR